MPDRRIYWGKVDGVGGRVVIGKQKGLEREHYLESRDLHRVGITPRFEVVRGKAAARDREVVEAEARQRGAEIIVTPAGKKATTYDLYNVVGQKRAELNL